MAGLAREKWEKVIYLRVTGNSVTEIARVMGCSQAAVSQTLSFPEVKALVEREKAYTLEQAQIAATENAPIMIDVLRRIAEDTTERASDRVKAATELLDRVGLTKEAKVKVEHSGSVTHGVRPLLTADEWALYTPEERERKKAELEARLAAGAEVPLLPGRQVIDVEEDDGPPDMGWGDEDDNWG